MSLRETKATGNEALNAWEGERVCVCGVWLPRGPGARNRGDGQISALHSLDKPRAPMALPYMPPPMGGPVGMPAGCGGGW